MKRLIVLLLMVMFFISLSSAIEWDNYGTYDKETKTMTINNGLTFGTDIAKIKLDTPLLNKVPRGYGKVAQFTITNYKDYDNALKILDFYDKSIDNSVFDSKNKLMRDYDYKILSYEEVDVPNYERVQVGVNPNSSIIYEWKVVGTRKETREKWTNIEIANFKENDIVTIGIFTDVQKLDVVEWIPNIMGVKIDEWAGWQESWNFNISGYYKFDEGVGTTSADATGNGNGLTDDGTTPGWTSSGQILNATDLETGSTEYWINATAYNVSGDLTINFWAKPESSVANQVVISKATGGSGQRAFRVNQDVGGNWKGSSFRTSGGNNDVVGTSPVDVGNWQMVTFIANGTGNYIAVDGVIENDNLNSDPRVTNNDFNFYIGEDDSSPSFDGLIDEVGIWNRGLTPTEISDIYDAQVNGFENGSFSTEFISINVTLNQPENDTKQNDTSVDFNFTISPALLNITNWTLTSWFNNGTLKLEEINTTIFTNETTTIIFNNTLFPDDIYIWNVQSCGNFTIGSLCDLSENRTFTIDTIAPEINITSPVGQIDYNFIGGNETLNVTFTDLDLDICWYDYNGTNVTIDGCITGIKNSTNFILEEDNFNITVYSNDSSGNENSSFIEWNYKVLEINQTFNVNTTEANTETFEANVILADGLSVAVAVLVYNGTSSVGSVSALGNGTMISVDDVVIPGVGADVNLSFFWALLLSDSTQINLSTQNQTVFSLGIDNCTTFNITILNFTNVDEELQTLLDNSTMEIAVNIFSSDEDILVLNLSDSFSTNPTTICLNIELTNDSNYLMNVIVKYSAESSAIEYFNIVDFVLNLQTVNQNITLFDLNLSDSTEFQLTFTGVDFLPVESVLVFVERQYISENVFKTVELPQTDANGQTVLHLVRNDIIYNLRFVKDGETLGTFENIIAFCQDFTIGDCIIDLSSISNESAFEQYGEFVGIIYDSPPSFDSGTNLVSFSFVSDDGTPKTVQMSVERRDIFGNQTVCTNAVISSSGTLFCNIGVNLTETVLFTIITVGDSDLVFNTVVIDETSFGDIGYAMWFFLTLILILMASDSKNAVVIVTLISFIGALSMGWFVGGAIGVGSSGIWVLVISTAALWQINRKRDP